MSENKNPAPSVAVKAILAELDNVLVNDEQDRETLAKIRTMVSALSAQVQDVVELDEKTIVRLAWENFSESDYGRLTYERAPPMFPQATYDVPTYALSQFVKAVRAAAPAKQEGGHD